jgi:hypothetical protein
MWSIRQLVGPLPHVHVPSLGLGTSYVGMHTQ